MCANGICNALLTLCTVLLQAMKEDPSMDVKCRDKFLVQSVAVSAEHEHPNVAAIVRFELFTNLSDADRHVVEQY